MYDDWGNRKYARNLFEKMSECIEVPWRRQKDVGLVCLRKREVTRMNGHPLALTRAYSISAASEQVYIGYAFFTSTNEDTGVTPIMDYCTCMVGLLGRAGQLTDAETLIKEMPFSLYIAVWPTLPGACTILGNPEFGALMAQRIFELDPQDDISYGMLPANYVGVGILDKSAEVRKLISDRRAKKEAGCSWNKTNDKPHLFMVEDPSIPQMDEMHAKLERLTEEIEEAGYMPDTKYMLHIVEMDKKESYLTYHSKKLAIAFWLTNTSAVIPLKINTKFHVWVIAILPSSCLQDCCAKLFRGTATDSIIFKDRKFFLGIIDDDSMTNNEGLSFSLGIEIF